MKYNNGDRYEGRWEDDEKNGKGSIYNYLQEPIIMLTQRSTMENGLMITSTEKVIKL